MTNTSNSTVAAPGVTALPATPHIPSVSLKIGRTSVMLYANRYRKPADGTSGYSTQEYLGSFSVHATSVPPAFDALLRQATVGRPERYLALLQRLETRVLEPARLRQMALEHQRQREQVLGLLGFARLQFDAVGDAPQFEQHLHHPSVQEAVALALASGQRLRAEPSGTTSSDVSATTGADEMAAPTEQAVPGSASDGPEQRLQALLGTINAACAEISQMMPEAAKQFRRGHPFEDETIQLVQQLWFKTSDAIAALNGRGPLKRPKEWDRLRGEST